MSSINNDVDHIYIHLYQADITSTQTSETQHPHIGTALNGWTGCQSYFTADTAGRPAGVLTRL